MIAYETQMIKNAYILKPLKIWLIIFDMGLTLYGSFVTMFIHTLFILQSFMGGDD